MDWPSSSFPIVEPKNGLQKTNEDAIKTYEAHPESGT
jgi:hypothetical protein